MLSCSLAHRGLAQQGATGVPGAPQAPTGPCPPRHILPQQGLECSGFAVSWAVPEGSGELAEGRSILRAGGPAALHQLGEAGRAALGVRELRLSRLQTWCENEVQRAIGRGVILSAGCKEGSISPHGLEQPPQPDQHRVKRGDVTQPSWPPLPQEKEVGYNARYSTRYSTYLLGPHHLPVGCRASPHA